jgi:hypothetical protein
MPPTKVSSLTYTKVTVHTRFLSESVAVADIDHDGNMDLVSGKFWYAGPNFSDAASQHIYRDGHLDLPRTGAEVEINTGVSDAWAAYTYDMDGDGWDDIIQIAAAAVGPGNINGWDPITPGTGYWYKNPANQGTGNWTRYTISNDMRMEHKGLVDVTGDGKPEILGSCGNCAPSQTKGYWQADWNNPTSPWTYHAVTRTYSYPGGAGWIHGIGAGDVNGDGRADLLERSGVWLQPADPTTPWTFINVALSLPEFLGTDQDIGGSNMFVYDVDGDGMNDIVNSLQSHDYGLAWFKQGPAGTFTRQMIMNTPAEQAMYNNVAVSQLHSLAFQDMDGDGLPDIVTGKTWLAHPYPTGDGGNMDPVLLYVFKLVRTPTVHFEPHLIDSDMAGGAPGESLDTASATCTQACGSGVGREFKIADINKDGIPDIAIASKRGLYVYYGKP